MMHRFNLVLCTALHRSCICAFVHLSWLGHPMLLLLQDKKHQKKQLVQKANFEQNDAGGVRTHAPGENRA